MEHLKSIVSSEDYKEAFNMAIEALRGQEQPWEDLNKEDVDKIVNSFKELEELERKHGRWEDFDCDNSYRCTACGEIWTLNDGTPKENNMNYCPKCGAYMEGKQE